MSFCKDDYHPKWSLISRLVCARDNHCCRTCGVKNNAVIQRHRGGSYRYITTIEETQLQERVKLVKIRRALKHFKFTKVALATAHLDRDRNNNRFENLKTLCQYCHLDWDRPQHLRNRSFGRNHDRPHQLQFFADLSAVITIRSQPYNTPL